MTPSFIPARVASFFRNRLSLAGLTLALIATVVGLSLLAADMLSAQTNPYAGILIYGVFPVLAGLGAAVALLGAWLERRHRKKTGGPSDFELPRIDLNLPRHRRLLAGAMAMIILGIVLLSVTGYRAYNFSDSVQFCGEVCHGVMKPEYTAYQNSPHARVACVSCHVGPGAGWFVRAKITGSYQVYSVLFHKYPRPIETPVHDLRPAQQTCEQCHWPAKFFGAQQKTFTHFMADEKNTPWQIQMLLKIGGGDPHRGGAFGIHWHMNINNDIYYVASDTQRQTIPYVKAVSKDGHVTEYMSTENPLSPAELAKATVRRMDCVDCHNRPSHIFRAPDQAVDQAMAARQMDDGLPYLKQEAMRLLSQEYKSETDARAAIEKGLPAFYAEKYPAVYKDKALAIRQATDTLQLLFSTNLFPEMKTDWRAHPNNIGHLLWDGCFRCHDGQHKSADGKVITKDCRACHSILAQGPPVDVARARLQAQPFHHPVDVGVDVTDMKCSQCHNGTTGL